MSKKILLSLLLLLIPFNVLATDTCDAGNIVIKSIIPKNTSIGFEEVSPVNSNNQKINLDLKMNAVGDYVEYEIVLNNKSNIDYYFNKDLFGINLDYLNYEVLSNDSSNIIKAGKEKTFLFRVIYKNKVPDNKLNDGIFNETDKVTLRLTDQKDYFNYLKNPKTGNSIIIYLIVLFNILFLLKKTKHINKTIILFIISSLIIPISVSALCRYDIEIESKIQLSNKNTFSDTIYESINDSCFEKYEGKVTDELDNTVDATNVYYDRCIEKRNVIFANKCWQIIRTNETKGIRMIYNGDPVDGKCESNRGDHKGIIGGNSSTMDISSQYLYSSSFTYNLDDNTFTLINPELVTWSDDTYENILGSYTCLDTTGVCTTLYNINGYVSNTKAYYTSYILDNTNYAQIGKSPYNLNGSTLNMIGYMYNKTHNVKTKTMSTTNYLYGNSYHYDEENDTYTLDGETQIIGDWETGYDKLTNTHYTCWNTTGTCKKLSYVFHTSLTSYNMEYKKAIYVELTKGLTIDEILSDWYSGENINKNDSTAKSLIENWYSNNLIDYSNYIEDSVYCSDISINDYAGFKPNGVMTDYRILKFNAWVNLTDISCNNRLYQFSTINNKAKLKYPISLLSLNDLYILTKDDDSLLATGSMYMVTPHLILVGNEGIKVSSSTLWYYPFSISSNGVRPVISLKPSSIIDSGSGSETNPWVVK